MTLTPKQQEKAVEKFAWEFEDKVKNGVSFDGDKMSLNISFIVIKFQIIYGRTSPTDILSV